MSNYPEDPDGEVLAELEAHGIDMTRPILFEFAFDVPDEATAVAVDRALTDAGYETETYYDDGELTDEEREELELDSDDEDEFGPAWTVYAKIEMVPRYEDLMRIQAKLDEIARPHGGELDGWEVQVG